MPTITTPRLKLTFLDLPTYEAIFAGMLKLRKYLNLSVPEEFSVFGLEPFQYTYNKLKANPGDGNWWLYLFILPDQQALAGVSGYKGPPMRRAWSRLGTLFTRNFRISAWPLKPRLALSIRRLTTPKSSLCRRIR